MGDSVHIEHLITSRPRDLGGLHVGRVLPAIQKRSVGPYLFLDHMGPEESGEISVRPHPHIHLATVTYLFEGEIHHRDSIGSNQVIQPGAINWMNAGKGIVHSERSDRRMLMHGLQLWVGLPRAAEDSEPSFVHYPADAMPHFKEKGTHGRVLIGSAYGATSPVKTASPMVYVDMTLGEGAWLAMPDGYAERAIYVVEGSINVGSQTIVAGQLAIVKPGANPLLTTDRRGRVVVLGGEPLDGPRYMWWNFVSSDKERIVAAAHAWREGKFPTVPGDDQEFIPAPPEDPHFAGGYHPPGDEELRRILESATTIAMVGASSNPDKPSYGIMKQLLGAGYHVIPVNPKETEVLGQAAVASLAEIREPVDVVDVFRKSEDTPGIADEAVAIGAKVLWLQQGISNDTAAAKALAGGLQVVMNMCIGATHRRLRIPPKA
jgi:redox-sensitive bicupin YhaK (pirin superfamily)/predicted CoA-binding protein